MAATRRHKFYSWLRAGLWPALMLFGLASYCGAAEIYTWVDEQGVTHFSETPPQDGRTQVEVLTLEPVSVLPSSGQARDIIDMANELEASRLARERAALDRQVALEKLNLEEKWLEQQKTEPASGPIYTYPVTVYPWRKHRPRPPHNKPGCPPHCGKPRVDPDGPFHETGRHGTTHLRPSKSLPDGP